MPAVQGPTTVGERPTIQPTLPMPTLPLPADCQSPSLDSAARRGLAAYEMKFLIDEAAAQQVESRLRPWLLPDPHGDPDLRNAYRLRTLYCDTPEQAVLERRGRFRLFKLRLRQYGTSPRVFLERKSKRGDTVRKRRTTIPLDQLPLFAAGRPDALGSASWFHRQLVRNRLAPVCSLEYERVAYFGNSGGEPVRLTFDRQIRGRLTSDWSLAPLAAAEPILPGWVVCEFKFRGPLPALFKAVIEGLQLVPRGVSKYRHGMQTLAAQRQEVAKHA